MSETKNTPQVASPSEPAPEGLGDWLTDKTLAFLNDVDDRACKARVEKLREKNPTVSPEELARKLIKSKSRRTGVVGAVTAAPATIPGLGTVTAFALGGVDITKTYQLQAELVLEIAEVYKVALDHLQRRRTIMLVTGVSVGSSRVFTEAGKQLAKKAGTRFAKRSFTKAIPMIGIGASAGVNMASTYAIGKRAVAYFSMPEEDRAGWSGSARAISGIDERKLVAWLKQTGKRGFDAIGDAMKGAGEKAMSLTRKTDNSADETDDEAGKALAQGQENRPTEPASDPPPPPKD